MRGFGVYVGVLPGREKTRTSSIAGKYYRLFTSSAVGSKRNVTKKVDQFLSELNEAGSVSPSVLSVLDL